MLKRHKYKSIIILLLLVIAQAVFISLTKPKRIPPPVKGKIAIVLDDWGYNLNNLELVKQIKLPLTISILPDLVYSLRVAQGLHSSGCEIILHLPMEPKERYRLEKNTILTSLDEQAVKKILRRDLKLVPYCRGVSNHMGSKATEDKKIIGFVFAECKKRKLYFLDSFVSPQSVCGELAKKVQLRFIRRDIFLDNKADPQEIKRQIYKLRVKAYIMGKAVGIGHDRKLTLAVLKEVMPQLEREGYRFVYLSEIVK